MTGGGIRQLEEAFYLAWPAAQVHLLHGWRLRFTDGVSRRANSVFPLDWQGRDVEADIRAAEDAYASQGLRPAFYLPPIGQPAGLDGHLAAKGYHTEGHVFVQTLDLTGRPWPEDGGLRFATSAGMTGDWVECFRQGSGNREDRDARAAIMARVADPCAYILARKGDEAVGCGMAVKVGDVALVQGMRTADSQRGKGIGTAILGELLSWAAAQGAKTAALQVETANPAALRLYGKAGFGTVYKYHYRIKN